jgi:hypothetical protein
VNASRAVLFVKMKYCFRIAVSTIDVAARFKLLAKICVIVNLAVVDYVKLSVFVRHGLVPCGHVYDAQAAMAQADGGVQIKPLIIGPAMRYHVAHEFKHTPLNLSA